MDMNPSFKNAVQEAYCEWFDWAKITADMKEIKNRLFAFYRKVETSGIPAFLKAIRTLKNWQVELLNRNKKKGFSSIGASTTFYNWNEQGLNISKNNWDWSKIEVTNVYHSKNDKTKRGIMVHEIGHALGLNHNDSNPKGGTVMWKNYKSSMANGPTLNDFKGINKLYK